MEFMSDRTTTKSAHGSTRRRSRWQLLIGLLVILAAGVHYVVKGYRPGPGLFVGYNPEPIEIAPELREAEALPAAPGALAGCNVLLVTMDTTRADRIGCYGNEDIETPALDRLAREGVVFSQATATSPSTLPSHTSILTGLYPAHHGSRVNGLYRLDDSHETLAEVLAESGYTTGAVISAFVLDSRFGLGQGFAHYDDDLSECEEAPLYRYRERKADKTTDRAIQWLRGVADDPFFLWVHYFDPHAAYEPPSPYAEEYEKNPYDGEIAFVDAQIGRLTNTLEELGLTDRTLVVVVGDHGESLGQHNELTHAFLVYEATLRVPLIVRCGQRLGGGVHIPRRVSQVDLAPTILSLLGLRGTKQTDGIDLTSLGTEPRTVFAETLHSLLVCGWAALLAVYDGPYKYIHGPIPELFDLENDVNEETNLCESKPEKVAALEQRLTTLFGSDLDMTDVALPTERLSITDLQRLEALGYVGVAATIPTPADRPDPKEMMPAMHVMERVVFNPDCSVTTKEGVRLLEQVVEKYPDFAMALRFLGDAYRLNGEGVKAADTYARCIEITPSPTPMFGLAQTKLYLGENDEAQALLRQIVATYPDHLSARYFLGVLAGQAKQYNEAIEEFLYIFDVDPDFVQAGMQPASVQLVQAAVLAGRADELPGILRPPLEADPRSVSVRAALAAYHTSQKQYAEAEALLREGVTLRPTDRTAMTNLALFLVSCPDPKARKPYEGVAMIESLCEQTAYQDAEVLLTLSTVYSTLGRLDEAIALTEKANGLAVEGGKHGLVRMSEDLLVQQKKAKEGGRRTLPPIYLGDDDADD